MQIKGYEIKGELKTNNSGFSKWGFATKNGKDYFIKEFIFRKFFFAIKLRHSET